MLDGLDARAGMEDREVASTWILWTVVEGDTMEIKNFQERIARIGDVLASASAGDFDARIETFEEDALSTVEYGINFMMEELNNLIEKDRLKAAQLEAQLEKIRAQEAAILELSTPIIQIWDDVLTLPVIGIVDSHRAEEMMVSLLNEVVAKQSRCVIIDITGVNVVDTKTADHFIKMVKAVKLLGAECIITGISPEIAQTITHLGVDLTGIQTRRNVQQGLQYAFKVLRYDVRKRE